MPQHKDTLGHFYPIPEPDGTAQVVAIGVASVASAALGTNTNLVILTATSNCWIAYGAAPTAAKDTAGSFYLPANFPQDLAVTPGFKFAVIEDSAAGFLSIQECS